MKEVRYIVEHTHWDKWFDIDVFINEQQKDPVLCSIRDYLTGPHYDPDNWSTEHLPFCVRSAPYIKRLIRNQSLYVERDLLWYNDSRLVVPTSLQEIILDYFHSNCFMLHQGYERMMSHIRQRFYWVGMDKACRAWLRNCILCSY